MPRRKKLDTRHKDVDWVLPGGLVENGEHRQLHPTEIAVALLMDMRDELKQGNTLLRAILAALKK